ncbi:MAG TPA: molybdopterin-dependent oxidoreductase, partial [Solirubrobacteraceae bacterium]|nr:molybdopterin-dependent oxidoreductase [Solirubrobacteraceae bacterium]
MSPVSRGFLGRRRVPPELAARLPPGQYRETGFPVLTAGPTPRIDEADYALTIEGLVATPRTWTLPELRALPPSAFHGDIHCVTKWSRLGTSFGGVSVDTLLDA